MKIGAFFGNLRHIRTYHIRQLSHVSNSLSSEIIAALKIDDPSKFSHIVAGSPLDRVQRGVLIKSLYHRNAYEQVIEVGRTNLFDAENGIMSNVSTDEMKKYAGALALTGQSELLTRLVLKLVAQFSLKRRDMVQRVINSIVTHLSSGEFIRETLALWATANWYLHGRVDFSNYDEQKTSLKTLLFFIREKKIDQVFEQALDDIGSAQGVVVASQMATTLLYLCTYNRDFPLSLKIWAYKTTRGLPIVSSDLTAILKANCHFENFSEVNRLHEKFPEAHDDTAQFDYVLVAFAKQQDWKSLQNQFNALFGIGELPNIQHYGIVMYAVAQLGEKDMVERLFNQLLRRKLIPTLPVLRSLVHVYYRNGDYRGCFEHFELFNKFGIEPSGGVCQTMLKMYRNLGDINGGLRFFKKMSENNVELSERHFATLINLCAKTTNTAIAAELFQVMCDHYHIRPTGPSIAALMQVYIESNEPQKALKLFREKPKDLRGASQSISIYNKAVEAYMRMGRSDLCEKLFQEILSKNLVTDSEFYRVMLRHLALVSKDYQNAENVLEQLITHPKLKVSALHFETLMEAYDKISYRNGVFKLYQKMLDSNVPVTSKILYFVIKSAFKTKLASKENLDEAIEMVNDIMKSAATRTLDVTFEKLHPSVMAWPMRTISKYYSPVKALELMNRYNELFFEKSDSANGRLVIMRSLLVLYGETHQWEEFEATFDRYLSKIQDYERKPLTMGRNIKLATSMQGVLEYKIKQLVATDGTLSIPPLLKNLESKKFFIDNKAYNEAVVSMASDARTLNTALQIADQKLIFGYNLIHKYRLLRRNAGTQTTTRTKSWFLKKKTEDPLSLRPTLYLTSETFEVLSESLDNYLNEVSNVENTLLQLSTSHRYFMKSYLMKPRTNVANWMNVERRHPLFFSDLRRHKRKVDISLF
ncbi:LAMI_0G17216g1_1 [Lachancea mirantina]|uniref:LAMI_0G17216g1_1 n=1 Tax=Lachancea mirantina TaxID=1230905 RepID=A0A1G4KCS2_9SACH|nr:LAMI_0G17216g1_1 [Lachancea mirantina]